MKKPLLIFSVLALLFCFLTPHVHASVPKLLTYQGILKDGSGNFLTGTYSIVFRVYSASTGGTALWNETQSSVSVSSGRFSVQLGSVTTLNLNFDQDYWLSVQVGSDSEMTPRQRLTSSGYAVMAEDVTGGKLTGSAHAADSHKNIEGVRDNTVSIAKTNFKLDAYSVASANSMGDMIVDTFNDSTGINSGSSSGYAWRGSPNYDVVATGAGIDSNVVLLLHANGTDASTTFTDSSDSSKSVSANGDAQIDTAQNKFGSASGLFDGSGDYLTVGDSADWDFGTGDFTIDFWVRLPNASSFAYIFDIGNAIGGTLKGVNFMWHHQDSQWEVNINNANYKFTGISLSSNTWYHIALVRSGTNLNLYQDGVKHSTTHTNSADASGSTEGLRIGTNQAGTYPLNGFIDEFRVSKGIARWTANFTPPSQEYSSGGTATVISNAYSEASAPTEAMVLADETLGSGSITYYVSRDNGTTWTECSKETVTSISSQPSGTQLKWKAVITGNAELNAIAVAN